MARLMLASQAGSLRLAIRSKDEELYRREQEGALLQASLVMAFDGKLTASSSDAALYGAFLTRAPGRYSSTS